VAQGIGPEFKPQYCQKKRLTAPNVGVSVKQLKHFQFCMYAHTLDTCVCMDCTPILENLQDIPEY
jgi:hypothetical protein